MLLNSEFIPKMFATNYSLEGCSQVSHPSLEEYTAKLNEYKQSLIPFGITLNNDTDTIGICLDIDFHKEEDKPLADSSVAALKILVPSLGLKYTMEQSGKGYKFWILFDKKIPNEVANNLQARLKAITPKGIEIYPMLNRSIRLPGLYKDKSKFSLDETGNELNTFQKVEEFLAKGLNNTDATIIAYGKADATKKPATVKKYDNGSSDYFDIVFEYIFKMPAPEPNTNFKCPSSSHADGHPSARIYMDENGQKSFTCFGASCELSREGAPKKNDAINLLMWHLSKDRVDDPKKKALTMEDAYNYLGNIIIKRGLLGHFQAVTGSGLTICSNKIAEAVINCMRTTESIDFRKDSNGVMYKFNKDYCPHWILSPEAKTYSSQVLGAIKDIICTMIGKHGKIAVNYLGEPRVKEISEIVVTKLNAIEDRIKLKFKHGMMIPVKNGVVDLKKYVAGDPNCLVPYTKDEFITGCLDVEYIPNIRNRTFEAAVDVYLPKKEKQGLFGQFVGAAMVPSIQVPQILFCIGTGGNGKGTLTSIVSRLFGDQASAVKFHTLSDKFCAFTLYGKILNIDPDAPMASLDAEATSMIKTITGDGDLSLQQKYNESFKYIPVCKFIIATNQLPPMGDINEAIIRRMMILNFDQKVPKNSKGGFHETLIESEGGMSGIFNWFLEHLKKFILDGNTFTEPEEMKEEKTKYECENDPIFNYINSLFFEDLNNAVKYPIKDGKRLSNNELMTEVYMQQVYMDFRLYCEQTGNSKVLKHTNSLSFARKFWDKIELLNPEIRKAITKLKKSKGKAVQFDLAAVAKKDLEDHIPDL